MYVCQLMHQPVIAVSPQDSISEAAQLLKKHRVGMLPVCQAGRLCGVITDRDLVTRGLASGIPPEKCPVRQVMTQQITCVTPDTELSVATYLMAKHKLRRLPVVQESQVVGMLSLGDLALARPYSMEVAQTLAEISKEDVFSLPQLQS